MSEKGKTLKKLLWAVSMWQGEGTNTEGGPAGRRPKPTVDKPVMFPRHDDEDWEDVILRPPPQKKSREQRKRPHDLMAAVSQNKLPGKKH